MKHRVDFTFIWLVISLLSIASPVWAQQMPDVFAQEPGSLGEGWRGFTDIGFLVNAVLTLALAAALGTSIAYHPKHMQTADTLEEIEAPKTHIMYAVVGAIIGIMVVKYGLVVGFVLFGIGGLMRFRTLLVSPSMTGRVILVTLIGLSCGLDLPHVAVLATAFGFILIYILDARVTYRINVKAIPSARIAEAAGAYRSLLEKEKCRIVSEKKNPERQRVAFVFQCTQNVSRDNLEELLETQVDETLKGSIDWEVD